MKLPEKGSFGYFDKKKKLTLTATIVSFLIVAAIYAAGIFIYHTNKSIFTVIAALSVLPAAKVFVSFLVISGCRSLPAEQKEELCLLTAETRNCRILYDILLASEEKALIAGTIVILEEHILMYSDSKKADAQSTENYIKKILEGCPYSSVKMYTEFGQMKKKLQQYAATASGDCLKYAGNAGVDCSNENDGKNGQQSENGCEHIEEAILIYTI